VTTIVERRSDTHVVFGFLAVVFALVVWRAWARAPGWSIAFAVLTVLTLLAWVWLSRKPLTEITVTADEIVCGPAGAPGTRIAREEATVLVFRQHGSYKHRTWWLERAGDPAGNGISMSGFRPQEVGPACRQHGWVFAEGSLF
jgi:hypothetical protein